MSSEGTNPTTQEPANGKTEHKRAGGQRVISRPGDIAGLVMMQIDAVNAKKDELTIAIKGLTDTAKQLVRAYADHAQAIANLRDRIKVLEGHAGRTQRTPHAE